MDFRLYETHVQSIYHYTYMLVGKKELAEDLTHDTFVKAYKSKQYIQSPEEQKKWLYTIARNTVYDHFKRAKLIQFISFHFKEERAATAYEPEEWLVKDEENYELYEALGKLSLDYRQAIVLRKIEGYSVKQAAEILGWNEAKVKNATERGMKKLGELLGGVQDEELRRTFNEN